jgi:hypothetical protein
VGGEVGVASSVRRERNRVFAVNAWKKRSYVEVHHKGVRAHRGGKVKDRAVRPGARSTPHRLRTGARAPPRLHRADERGVDHPVGERRPRDRARLGRAEDRHGHRRRAPPTGGEPRGEV